MVETAASKRLRGLIRMGCQLLVETRDLIEEVETADWIEDVEEDELKEITAHNTLSQKDLSETLLKR